MNLEEKEISRECLYRGPIFSVDRAQVLLPDGRPARRDIVKNADAVCVAALDDEKNLLLVKQWRIAAGKVLTESLDSLPSLYP